MSAMKTFYVGVKGVIVKNGKMLILKRKSQIPDYLFWDLPGGRIDDDETIEQTLVRELREEAIPPDKHIEIGRLLHAWRWNHTLKDGQGLFFVYYEVHSDIEDPTLSSEHIGYKWVGKQDIPALLKGDVVVEEGLRRVLEIVLEE